MLHDFTILHLYYLILSYYTNHKSGWGLELAPLQLKSLLGVENAPGYGYIKHEMIETMGYFLWLLSGLMMFLGFLWNLRRCILSQALKLWTAATCFGVRQMILMEAPSGFLVDTTVLGSPMLAELRILWYNQKYMGCINHPQMVGLLLGVPGCWFWQWSRHEQAEWRLLSGCIPLSQWLPWQHGCVSVEYTVLWMG